MKSDRYNIADTCIRINSAARVSIITFQDAVICDTPSLAKSIQRAQGTKDQQRQTGYTRYHR